MRPFRILIFFAAVLALLYFVALTLPENGIGISEDIRISFISPSEIFKKDTLRKANVASLLSRTSVTDDPESGEGEDIFHLADTVQKTRAEPIQPVNTDSLQQAIFKLQFADGAMDLLTSFFMKLDGLKDGSIKGTRILHFGDSQIENDRMTSLIRYRLQQNFGGSGSGLVPAIPLYAGNLAFDQTHMGEWLRYTIFGKRDTTIRHNCYGIMGSFTSVPVPEAYEWPLLQFRFNTKRRAGKFERVQIFLHSYVDSASLVFQVNDTRSDTIARIDAGFSRIDFRPGEPVQNLRMHFNLPEGGRIHGISFESIQGLQMDNIAMRGGSGLVFSKLNRDHLTHMLDDLDPGLIILQFGGNVVPYIENTSFYQRVFKRELLYLKALCPSVPVVVIGPSDMSIRERGHFNSYPAIEPVRDALENATLESGYAFWDLYQAMGGYNSMPSFVHTDPPLASTDHVHFTPRGANLVAEMFYNALMLEYANYSSKKPFL